MSAKKQSQLGMNPSTAQGRLVKDLLWSFVSRVNGGACCKCGRPMDRDTFSIEHLVPWLDSVDPIGTFFDLKNISYSHLRCNMEDRRFVTVERVCGTMSSYRNGCKCPACVEAKRVYNRERYTAAMRQAKYQRTGT